MQAPCRAPPAGLAMLSGASMPQSQARKRWEPYRGHWSQAEDEFVLHGLERLAAAIPDKSEKEIAERLTMMAMWRAVHRAVQQ